MSKILKFEPRKVSNARLKEQLEAYDAALQAINQNEQITRVRVGAVENVVNLGLMGRVKWLLFGMPKPKPEAEKAGPDVH